MAEANLSNLPVEVLHRIFYYCDARTILKNIRCVCKRLYDVVKHYNQIELELEPVRKCGCRMNFHSLCYSIPAHVVSSLIVSSNVTFLSYDEICKLADCIDRFTELRSLSLRNFCDPNLEMLFQNLKRSKLVSLSINSEDDRLNRIRWSTLLFLIKRLNLRKLCLDKLSSDTDNMSWPVQFRFRLAHLTINNCALHQYYVMLKELPYLQTFGLDHFSVDDDETHITSVTSKITYLIIRNCTLSRQQFKSVLSTAPALHHLSIGFRNAPSKTFVDIFDWENFVQIELNFLNRLDFFYYQELSSNGLPSFSSIMAPFQESFWLSEKRWFVAYECMLESSFGMYEKLLRVENAFQDENEHRVRCFLFS